MNKIISNEKNNKKLLTKQMNSTIIIKRLERGAKKYRGVEQSVARRAHNPKVVGSSPASATMLCNQKRYCTGKPRNHNGFWAFSYPDFQVQTKRYFSLLRGLELPTPTISGGFQEDFSSESRLFFVFAENFF